jgi:hypothetical protein
MGWAQRQKRVFAIEIEQCERCGGQVKIIASIEDPAVIERILAHLAAAPASTPEPARPARGPPGQGTLALN